MKNELYKKKKPRNFKRKSSKCQVNINHEIKLKRKKSKAFEKDGIALSEDGEDKVLQISYWTQQT